MKPAAPFSGTPGRHRLGRRARVALFWAWVAGIVVIIIGSLLPSDAGPMLELDFLMTNLSISDKVVHCLGYASLALVPPLIVSTMRRVWGAVFGLCVLGLLLEFAQQFVPGRTCDMADFLANDVGLALGTMLGLAAARILSRLASLGWHP